MKRVTAIINPFALNDVREALTTIGIQGMTVTEVKGYGRQKGHRELYRGTEYTVSFNPKIRLQIVVEDNQTDAVIDAIIASARTGNIGDGKIFVADLENVLRIRTGEQGQAAL